LSLAWKPNPQQFAALTDEELPNRMLGEGTILFGVFAGRGYGRIARNRLGSFAQFAGNEKFSSPLGLTLIDR
jgi:hypothetical protein